MNFTAKCTELKSKANFGNKKMRKQDSDVRYSTAPLYTKNRAIASKFEK